MSVLESLAASLEFYLLVANWTRGTGSLLWAYSTANLIDSPSSARSLVEKLVVWSSAFSMATLFDFPPLAANLVTVSAP